MPDGIFSSHSQILDAAGQRLLQSGLCSFIDSGAYENFMNSGPHFFFFTAKKAILNDNDRRSKGQAAKRLTSGKKAI